MPAGTNTEPSVANDAEVPIASSYRADGHPAMSRWAEHRLPNPPYRPRFMVYSGLGSPEMTAQRLGLLQSVGAESFQLAADLPSQLGFDPDHELAFAQVGRAGVSVTTLDDFATICSQLDLQRADSIGLLANSLGHVGLGMASAVLADRGATDVRLVMQNDPLKEFTARGTEIHQPEEAVRIACDCIAYAIDNDLPGAAMTVCSNHYDVAGAGPVVGVAFAFANAFAYIDELVERGYRVADILDKLMFFLNERSDLWVTASLFRTARALWADLVRERYALAIEDQPIMQLQGYAHGLESADEPLVNLPRTTLSVLGAMLGGVDYLCATGYDEALRIPSADAAALAVRTMQVVAHEHGALATIDPLDGSHKVAAIDRTVEERIRTELDKIDEQGGALKVLHNGYISQRIDDGRGTRQRQLDTGERDMVGRSVYASPENRDLFSGQSSREVSFADVEQDARDRLAQHKKNRDSEAVRAKLAGVVAAAAGTDNLLPPTIDALRAGATGQEIVDATKEGFRE